MDVDSAEVSPGPRPVEIEVVRGAMTRLSLLAQTLSGAHQGDAERYADNVADALGDALAGQALPVVLTLREGAIYYAGTEVSGSDLVTQSIVSRLVEEGLSALTILPGVPREELFELSHLLARPRETEATVETLARLGSEAWALQLRYVHFETEPTRLATEADEAVRPLDLARRLADQLGIGADTLEPHAFVELGATLSGVRALTDAPRAGGVARPPTGSVWGRALRGVRSAEDVPDSNLSVLVTEALRCPAAPADVTALATAWLDCARAAFRRGEPGLAGHILRPVLVCADPRFRPPGLDAGPIRAALATFAGRSTRDAILHGLRLHPQTDDWIGPLFTLGGCATLEDHVLELAEVGAGMGPGPVREALGDGLVQAIEALDGVSVRSLLSRCSDAALPALLQAARRFADPTLIEPLLARTRHDDPTIREAAMFALRAQQSPRIKTAAREAIEDSARSVRLEALRYASVYRDTESADVVGRRVRSATDIDAEELRALCIAWLHTSRGSALVELEALAGEPPAGAHPDLPAACIGALGKAGAPGRAALDRLGRAHPELRPHLRDQAAPRSQERSP